MTKKKDGSITFGSCVIKSEKIISFLDAIQALTPECRLEICSGCFEVSAVDPGNVAMVRAIMASPEFETYGIPPATIGLDLKRAEMAMPLMKDEITIRLSEDKKILVFMDGETEYTNALLDVNTIRKKPEIPSLNLPVSFECAVESLSKSLSIASKIQDKIILEIQGEQVTILAESSEGDKLRRTIECTTYPNKSDKARSVYSLDYLNFMMKGFKGRGIISVQMGENKPLMMETHGTIGITYLLAPRIEDEEEKKDPGEEEGSKETDS